MNPKTIETLISKIGLTPVQAVWVMGLSEKHALWIGNQIKANPALFPKEGGNIKKVLTWIKKNPGIDLGQYDYGKALSASLESEKTSFKRDRGSLKNVKIVAICEGSQYKWVVLKTEEDCVEEGIKLRHCLRNSASNYLGEGKKLFSLRDEYNKPILTIQIIKGKIRQYSAKWNNRPDEKYNQYIEVLEKQAKVTITEESKVEWRILELKVGKVFDGDLDIDNETELPAGLRVKGNLTISSGDTELPKGLVMDGDLILEDYAFHIEGGITVKGDIILSGSGAYSFHINLKKIKFGGKIIFNA